jgi:demethylmenaquinone methyltransferase/2-methoxy-6-polyprenyl-1,4-benzoquinol methylase
LNPPNQAFSIFRRRRLSLKHLQALKPTLILDVATGTGDFALDAFHYLQPERVIGIDLSAAMMEVGKQKAASAGLSERLHFEQADCLDLPYENNRFDAILSAFGIRNFENILLGL